MSILFQLPTVNNLKFDKITPMNKNAIIISIVSVLGTFLLLFVVYKLISQSPPTNLSQVFKIKAGDHLKWSTDKKNLLIEYSDFQCPACRNAHAVFQSFEASGSADFELTKKATLVFRHFPLYQIHDKALSAAYASEAAAKQGKFWEMADLLFTNINWETSNNPKTEFINFAKDLKLDQEKFKKDIDSPEVKNKVDADLKEAEALGLNSTPTFFLNGQKLDLKSFDELKTLLKNL